MSVVDYQQTAEDHQNFLVLVRHTGKQLTWKHFCRCWERITQLDCVAIPGQKRDMWIRYKRTHSRESNEWGDFQVHRKALGLVSIGRCSNEVEFQELFENYKKEKECYSDTLYNSRLLVFGMNTDGSPLTEDQQHDVSDSSPAMRFKIDGEESDNTSLDCDTETECSEEVSKNNNGFAVQMSEVMDPLRSIEKSPKKESDIKTVSEINKNEPKNTKEKSDNQSPGSQITFIRQKSEKVVDKRKEEVKKTITRTNSNNSIRDTGAEVVFYPGVDDCDGLEESIREFVTSLFFVLEGKRLDRAFERGDRTQLLCAPFEKKDFVGVDVDTKSFKKKCQGRLRKHLADLCLLAGLPGEAMLHYTTAIDILKPVNDYLWMAACYEGLCATSVIAQHGKSQPTQSSTLRRNQSFSLKRGISGQDKQKPGGIMHSYANGLQDLPEAMTKSNLNPDDIVEKYKDALMYYSKYKNAAIIEMEASFKACRILIVQRKYLQASDFLQNVVYINLQLSDEDRINRYGTLANLYAQIGFNRKASFFRRVAAMQCVAPQNPRPNWPLCHQLLIQALRGYKIFLDPRDSTGKPGEMNGWPVIQCRVLHELIYSAKRMGNLPLAIRYLTILLHSQLEYMSSQEKRELVSNLENFTSQCEGHTQPLALESGAIVPHVPLIHIPYVKTFKLARLPSHLEPKKIQSTETTPSNNVFIFTPLNLGVIDTETVKTDVDFCWVDGDIAEIQLQVSNPMPDDLVLSHIGLMTEGLEIETFPATPNIPAEHSCYLVKVMLRPCNHGDLKVLGYNTKLYGVRSNCKLLDCPIIPQPYFKVKVTPALPQLQVTSSLPKSADFLSFGEEFNIVTSGTAVLYTGQSSECTVTLQNTGKLPVEWIKVGLESTRDTKEYVSEVFQWNSENIQSQLPLQVSSVLCFNLALTAIGDFLIPASKELVKRSMDSSVNRTVSLDGRTVEGILKVDYSGGPGYQDNYCRCCSIAFSIEVLPSVVFHKWDVMLSESSEHCYLLFDLQNVSGHAIEVYYSSQCVYMKPEQIKRVCIELERCEPRLFEGHSNTLQQFSQMLATFVDIRWVIPSENVNGKVDTGGLNWTSEQQQLVYKSPVSWDVRLNSQLISPLHIGSLEYKIGQLVRVEVEVVVKSDVSDIEGSEGLLSICCCQHYDNGAVNYSTQQYVSTIGAQSLLVPEISADVPISHSCVYIFTCCGFYKFEINMKVKGQGHTVCAQQVHVLNVTNEGHKVINSKGHSTEVSCEGHKSSKGLGQTVGHGDPNRKGPVKCEESESDLQILKCSSVIEVNVIE